MILSADELQIVEYLKSWEGEFVSMTEISRRAAGRKKFLETPNWAKGMMSRLVEANLVQMNERGHFRSKVDEETAQKSMSKDIGRTVKKKAQVIEEDYFPESDGEEIKEEKISPVQFEPQLIDEDYFPGPEEPLPTPKQKPSVVAPAPQFPVLIDEDYFAGPEEPLPEAKRK